MPVSTRSRKYSSAAASLPRRHRTPQLVGFAGREAGRDDRQLHHLFLEQGHAERALEHLPSMLPRIVDRLQLLSPAQVGMHHAFPGSGPGRTMRDFDDQVVELAGFIRGSIDICARDSIWNTPMVSARWIIA